MKLFLSTVALASVLQCHAFTSPLSQSPQIQRVNGGSRSKAMDPLPAFKFPSILEKEEESLDIILPPANSQLDSILETISDATTLTLRVATCSLMIHHGIDKIINVDGFSANVVAKFFGFLPGDPSFWTISAAATQVVGSGLLAVGILSRPVAFSMMMTMVVAVVFHLLNTGLEGFPLAVVSQHSYNYELAAMYVGVLAYFTASGAGKFSADELVLGGELNLYNSILNKVFDGENDENVVIEEESNSFKLPW